MKLFNKRKIRYLFARASIGLLLCCACLIVLNGVVSAQGVMGMEDVPSSTIDDRVTDFTSGPVESISDSIIKVRGVEYTFSMDMKCMDMNERPVDIESIHVGDSVNIIFDTRNNEVLSLTLEQRASAIRNPPVSPREKKIQDKRKVILEDGVYKY